MFKAIWRRVSQFFGETPSAATDVLPQESTLSTALFTTGTSGGYSIRESLQGALHDFVRSSGFENVHLEEMIREFVGLLAAYREEDLPLFPEVYLFSSPNGLTALAPSTTRITLESRTEPKDCAKPREIRTT